MDPQVISNLEESELNHTDTLEDFMKACEKCGRAMVRKCRCEPKARIESQAIVLVIFLVWLSLVVSAINGLLTK
jgi:hypothetical protein